MSPIQSGIETETGAGSRAMAGLLELAERGTLPDAAIRLGIRRLIAERLAEVSAGGPEEQHERFEALVAELRRAPVAVATGAANDQHYEVPAELFRLTLGEHLKYSACLWPLDRIAPVETLDEAERRMLDLTVQRAGIRDGDRVLDLGCGWGSLSLWIAERFPGCRVTAVSNSASQRQVIEERCRERGLDTVEVITADVNRLALERTFDRVVSVEMLEHVRNHPALFARVAAWLRPGGTFFVHVFCHRRFPYLFEPSEPEGAEGAGPAGSTRSAGSTGSTQSTRSTSPGDWMARTFFTGGVMPSPELLLRCQDRLTVRRQWLLDGRHYERTARAWLANLDRNRDAARRVLAGVHGAPEADRWLQRWRIFHMAVAELFGTRRGREWMVCHTLFENPAVR
ncbi:MAG: cyclopropane-fatty-acyl-phospholipid synthase family protein [Acidobacteriota bacterium]|jgi:cyclopropane-fatty-acyl-phospholipid synthase